MNRMIALCALALASAPIYADTITVNLQASTQNYTLNGAGGFDGYGTYFADPGSCVTGATDTTCTLSGIYSGTTPGYTGGSYSLVTTFDNSESGLPAMSSTQVAVDGGNYFTMGPNFSSDVNITLYLNGTDTVPVAVNGTFVADSLSISATNPTCEGLPQGVACTQGNVGMNPGSSISSPVTETLAFESPVPEPQWLALGGLIPGALMVFRRRRSHSPDNAD
jgi:hypothetical protein